MISLTFPVSLFFIGTIIMWSGIARIEVGANMAYPWSGDLKDSRLVRYMCHKAQFSWYELIEHQRDTTETRNKFADSDFVSIFLS